MASAIERPAEQPAESDRALRDEIEGLEVRLREERRTLALLSSPDVVSAELDRLRAEVDAAQGRRDALDARVRELREALAQVELEIGRIEVLSAEMRRETGSTAKQPVGGWVLLFAFLGLVVTHAVYCG